jgi:hypothetical protein
MIPKEKRAIGDVPQGTTLARFYPMLKGIENSEMCLFYGRLTKQALTPKMSPWGMSPYVFDFRIFLCYKLFSGQ